MEESLATMERSAEIMRRSSDRINSMQSYRVYLLDSHGRIEAAESFSASGNVDATEVAASIYDACSDVFGGFEIWHGGERISQAGTGATRQSKPAFDEAIQRHQDTVLDIEEKLFRAFACVNRSRKLLETSAKLRDRMNTSEGG